MDHQKNSILNDDENGQNYETEEEFIGPLPTEAEPPAKKKKVLKFESIYLDNLPSSEMYEKSYMHRDVVTHLVLTRTDFLITGSCDGHVKFWKKMEEGIEFVKHFRAHLGSVQDLVADAGGKYLASVSSDKSLKVFDVVNFDMINMADLSFVPYKCEWIHKEGDALIVLAVSDSESPKIYVYDAQAMDMPLKVLEKLHMKPVTAMKYNSKYEFVISFDQQGLIEYWTGTKGDFDFPKAVKFSSKLDTDLFTLVKNKTYAVSACLSPNGLEMAIYSADRQISIFKILTGKLIRVIDESLSQYNEEQQTKHSMTGMEFSRRAATERELDKNDGLVFTSIVYDETGYYLLVPTLIGVKIINLYSNTLARIIGKPEHMRFLQVALFQGKPKKHGAASTIEIEAADNPAFEKVESDPTLFCTAFKKNRFFIFSKREPIDVKVGAERDIFNEKPSKEDMVAATDAIGMGQRLYETAVLHSSLGDITIKLFGKECPKTVENFCVHSKNGYYNGHIFHRVIKQFMIQTGDPTGTGTGGESIWGGEFEDEFHPSLRHDRPYTPWLDNKHTVFGRVIKGMEVVQNISQVKVHPKTDKPYEDVKIISVTVR
ncbi:hypothetical protein QYM36_015492 [Artemia franciscana]|uniref:peptidylprolyl isomerase n=1 Tax=Artemia franciscana TaxID=6661 RepID=A0AA88HF50_ARTSF|nr:hypothetical protein QYM36_015492 [Artemia franciscana]